MNNLKHKTLYFLLVVFLATAVACQGNNPDDTTNDNNAEESTKNENVTETEDEQTIITFAVNGWERGLYEERVKAFEELHPDVKVELISTDELLNNRTTSGNVTSVIVEVGGPNQELLNLVQGADIISWYIQTGSQNDGLLLDLAPLMTSDDSFDVADFYPGVLEQFQWDGGIWGVPTNANYSLILYDKDLFDKAGVAYPEVGWSWDDFVATAQDLTLREGDEVTQWGFSNQFSGPMEMVQAKVGPLFDLKNDPPTSHLEDPEVVEAFQLMVDLFTKYEVSPYAKQPENEEEALAYDEQYQMLEEGKIAMWSEYAEAFVWRGEERNLGVVPFPISEENEFSSPMAGFGGGALAVSAGTAHPQIAWEWIKFLTQQHDDDSFAFGPSGPTNLPARKSVAEASGVWDDMDAELAAALRFAVEHGFSVTYSPVGGEKVYRAVDIVIDEGRDMAEVLAEAQQEFEEKVAEYSKEQAKATPIPDFTVAEPPSSQIEEGDVVVRFVVAGGDPSVYREMADQFNESHPDIVIKVEEPNFYNEEFSLKSLVGDADVFQWWNTINSEDDLAQVLALQPFLDADPDLAEDDFFPAVLNQFREQGQLVGLPGEVQISFLSYNKRLFDAAGVDYPEAGWTMDEFLTTAVALTSGDSEEDKVYGYVPDLYELGDLFAFMARQDVELIDQNVEPATLRFDDPQTIAAVRWYSNLTTEYGVKPVFDIFSYRGVGPDPYEEYQALIDNDRAAIWKGEQFGGRYVSYDENGEIIEEPDTSHVGFVPYPVGDGGLAGFESVSGYYIAADTEVRQAAWEWLKYLTAQESLAQNGLPAHISAAQSEEFAQRTGADKAAVMIAAVENSTQGEAIFELFASTNEWLSPALSFGMQSAYNDILSGEATVEEALKTAQEKADTYRQCIIDKDLVGSNEYQEFETCMQEAGFSEDDF